MSASVSPALASATSVAGTGPMPMTLGATPATPQDTSRTSGVSPSSAAFSGVVTTHIDAASFCPLELPAVTVALRIILAQNGFELGQGLHRGVGAGVLVGVDHLVAARASDTVTGMISSANRPSVCAADRAAVRQRRPARPARRAEIEYWRRRFSAVSSMPPGTG